MTDDDYVFDHSKMKLPDAIGIPEPRTKEITARTVKLRMACTKASQAFEQILSEFGDNKIELALAGYILGMMEGGLREMISRKSDKMDGVSPPGVEIEDDGDLFMKAYKKQFFGGR